MSLTTQWISAVLAMMLAAACGPVDFHGTDRNSVTESKTYTEPLTRVIFTELAAGDLSLTATSGGPVEVTRTRYWPPDKSSPQYTETVEGKTLRISYTCEGRDCAINYEVKLPAGTEVQAKTTSGDITVRNMTAPLDLETTSGSVNLYYVKGDLNIKVTSGDVSSLDGIRSKRVAITTTSGETHLKFLEAPQAVTVNADSGFTNLVFDGAPQSVKVNSASGGIVIYVPEKDAYRLRVKTTSGDQEIYVDRSETAPRHIDIESKSGDVRIEYG